jgi:site-specific DNA recombinase
MNKPQKRVAIYARVSTTEQAEEGYSIPAQLRILNEYCISTGKTVFKEYVDRGVSGKSINGRLELQQLLRDAQDNLFDEVIVWKINRLARKQLDLLKIVDTLNRYNISFRSYSENFETETPMGKFALQMMGAVGELERNTIVDNVKMGMKQRAREGKWNGGQVLGYKVVELPSNNRRNKESMLEIVPEEATLVKYIFNLYSSGKGLKAITNQINHEGFKTKKGNPFNVVGIKEILNNPIYIGKIRYNLRENWSEKRRKGINPEPIIVDGKHDAIIDEELWNKVRDLYSLKSGRPTRVFDGSYPLTGLLRCPECGQGMVAGRVKDTLKDGTVKYRRYYHCGAWKNKGTAVCLANGINADYADKYIFERLSSVLCNDSVLNDIVSRLNQDRLKIVKPSEEELGIIEKNIADIVGKREKYFRLYEEDIIDKDILSSRLEEIANEVNSLEQRKQKLIDIINNNDSRPVPFEDIKRILQKFNEILLSTNKEKQKTLLQLIIQEITVTNRKSIDGIKLRFNDKITKFLINKGDSPDDEGESPSSLPKNKNLPLLMVRFTVFYSKPYKVAKNISK